MTFFSLKKWSNIWGQNVKIPEEYQESVNKRFLNKTDKIYYFLSISLIKRKTGVLRFMTEIDKN